jgi:hypothetical protein
MQLFAAKASGIHILCVLNTGTCLSAMVHPASAALVDALAWWNYGGTFQATAARCILGSLLAQVF